jgi:hypothetical protein
MGGIYWLASYPKSGNTWFRAFLQNLRNDSHTPVDINELSTGLIASARVWLDEVLGFDTAELSADEIELLRPYVYQWSLEDDQVGYHKIHDAYTLTSECQPIVSKTGTLGALYIIRNPLDIVSSLANHNSVSIDQAIEQMASQNYALSNSKKGIGSQVKQNIYSWSEHVLSWVEEPSLSCLTIRYEDMSSSPIESFTKAAQFLGLPNDPGRIAKAVEFSSFKELAEQEKKGGFKETPIKTTRFFREGKSGGWRSELTGAQIDKVVASHNLVMRRYGYLNNKGEPI